MDGGHRRSRLSEEGGPTIVVVDTAIGPAGEAGD